MFQTAKSLLLTFLLATVSLAQAGDHIELGGTQVGCVYLIREGQDTEFHLIFPDGRDIEVTVEARTSIRTMDKELQEIADQQKP